MEAVSNDFAQDNFLETIATKSKEAMSNYWVLIDPKSDKNVTNTDIVLCINSHHKSLDNDHEVGVKIEHLGKQVVFYIDHIAHQNQSMIYFKGHTAKGKLVHFVKHSSELKIELQSLKRRSPEEPKSPFGFADWNAYNKAKLSNS